VTLSNIVGERTPTASVTAFASSSPDLLRWSGCHYPVGDAAKPGTSRLETVAAGYRGAVTMSYDEDPDVKCRPAEAAFDRFATFVSELTGRPVAFAAACLTLVLWAFSGPVFGFSNTWQLIINTGTTIVTFMMVFVIQHSENKNSRALQMKLDELIAATDNASNRLIDIEDLSEAELNALHERFRALASTNRLGDPHDDGGRQRKRQAPTSST
jgi:low affinity Fe/Cu permease